MAVVGDDDDLVALDESDEALELVELRLHLLAPRLLGQRVRQQRQLLVRVLQVRPVASETLLVRAGRNECQFLGSFKFKKSHKSVCYSMYLGATLCKFNFRTVT